MSESKTAATEFDKQSVIVERAVPADAEAVYEVHRQTWLDTYPNEEAGVTEDDIRIRVEGKNAELVPEKIERWRKRIESADDNSAIFVAKVGADADIVGFVAPAIIDGQHRVGALYVLPEAQGKGVGSMLIKKVIEFHGSGEPIYLHVASYNQAAIDFYKRFGFRETGQSATDEAARLSSGKLVPEIEMVFNPKATTSH